MSPSRPGIEEKRSDVIIRRLRHGLSRQINALVEQYKAYGRLMRLDRPIGIWLLLWPTLWALWLASEGRPSGELFAIFVLGTVILRSAGCIINDVADRKIDRHVARTRDRPLASGDIPVAGALVLFFGLMFIGLALVLMLSPMTQYLAVGGALITLLYPFAKRFIATPQLVLGIAFSWGVPMAYAAELGSVPRDAWLLFLVTMVWVVVYDTEYAMTDRPDDIKLGVNSTAILFGELDRVFIGGLQLLLLLGLILVGRIAGLGTWYLLGLSAAAVLMLYQQLLIRDRKPDQCFAAFLNNGWLGACVFFGILLDYALQG